MFATSSLAAGLGGGIGLGAVLSIVFAILKFCGKITWPWLWVAAPLWIPPLAFVAFLLICAAIASALSKRKHSG